MSVIASFTPRDRQRVTVSGIGGPFAASITALYSDGSAFIIRDAHGRISVIRSNPHLGCWTLGRRPVEIDYATKSFEQLMEQAWGALKTWGIERPKGEKEHA